MFDLQVDSSKNGFLTSNFNSNSFPNAMLLLDFKFTDWFFFGSEGRHG